MEMQIISPRELGEHDTVLDVRRHTGSSQIRGALRYDPKALLAEEHVTLPLPLESRVVLHTDHEDDSEPIAQRLRRMGVHSVVTLRSSIGEVREAGVPVEHATTEQPVPEVPDAGA